LKDPIAKSKNFWPVGGATMKRRVGLTGCDLYSGKSIRVTIRVWLKMFENRKMK
jgi:hypothetical protein